MTRQGEDSLLGPYRVLDLTDEKGVLCTKLMADMGADVIKVEPPGGDPMRGIGPYYHDEVHPEKSLFWFTFNTGKRSITLDIEQPPGRKLLTRLAATADFLVECFPPGHLDSLGLGYAELGRVNPGLVMTSVTPYGQTGPYRDYRASDITGLAMGGLLYLIGEPHRPPVRVRAPQAYTQAGAQALGATMVAFYHREVSGEGQHVDVSMQEAVSLTLDTAQQAWDLQQMLYRRIAPFRPVGQFNLRCVYPCKDGYVACWAPEELQGIKEWMDEEGIPYDEARMAEWIDIRQRIAAGETTLAESFTQEEVTRMQEVRIPLLMKLTRRQIYEGAVARGFGWAPVNTPRDLVESEQLAARGYYVQLEHPELGGTITYPGAPARMTETPLPPRRRAPLVGEHNLDVYQGELGIGVEEMRRLREARVV